MSAVVLPSFANEPILELRRTSERARLHEALEGLDAELPLRAPMLVAGERHHGDALPSTDPGHPERLVAVAPLAGRTDVEAALAATAGAFPAWAARPAADRAAVLSGAAAWMRAGRARLAALCVRECAKPWPEADADVCEAIDFLEYYAREALRLDAGAPVLQAPGERNTMRYAPRGVCAVIAPWNFPLAIPTGMAAAALATGNTVVLKPAEQAPGCGAMVAEALLQGGLPPAALALLHGEGDVGAALVDDPRVATIAFTGSGAVGLQIAAAAARVAPGQRHLKRTVLEMGGKNCVIVDADADLDEVVPGVLHAAFGYAGQKCSAASRLLVHEAVADGLLERLAGALATLQVGQADRFGTDVPPLIERAAQERLLAAIDACERDGRLVARGAVPAAGGWFVGPAIVADLPSDASPLTDELFGPLLTVERVPDVEAACDRVDALPVALTGGLYARNPRTVARVAARTPVGNLYVNRAITGAMVGRQPFGGNRLSGTGTKAGGPDYLLQFVEPRVVTENTVRHGLVV